VLWLGNDGAMVDYRQWRRSTWRVADPLLEEADVEHIV
jgi:hypothetical protein